METLQPQKPQEIENQSVPAPIFDKLLDHKHYTGTHKHRFDKNGKGRGLKGRDSVAKGNGTIGVPYTGGLVTDIGNLMRLEHYSPHSTNPYKVKKSALGHSKSAPALDKEGGATVVNEPAAPPIFNRLMDPAHFTGTHTHRFDEHGKGKGLNGRDRIPKGPGTLGIPTGNDGAIRDIAQILRTHDKDAEKLIKPIIEAKELPKEPCSESGCKMVRSIQSNKGMCAFHMWVHKEPSTFPKPGLTLPPAVIEKLKTKVVPCKKKKCGQERKQGDPQGFCNFHAWLRDNEKKKPDEIRKPRKKAESTFCTTKGCHKPKHKKGLCIEHYKQANRYMEESDSEDPGSDGEQATKRRKKKPFTIFDKLTNPAHYTASHAHRFDKRGKGRGLKGRDYVPKQSAFGKYHGGRVIDLSQICRPYLA